MKTEQEWQDEIKDNGTQGVERGVSWQPPEEKIMDDQTFARQNPELFREHYQSTPHGCPTCKGTGVVWG